MGRCRTFRFRLYPTVGQTVKLTRLIAQQCELYNAALEERRGAWKWERRSVSYVDQCRTLTELRGVRPEVLLHGVVVCRGTLKRLDRAFSAFYRRCQAGETPGFPRFKSLRRWDSVQWEDRSGWRIDADARRLHLLGMGAVKLHLHRPLRGVPKALTVRREGRHWWVSVRCAEVPAQPLPETGKVVGIDLGVGVLVATSDGKLVANDQPGRRAAARVARLQQELARKTRGSRRRRKAVERLAEAHRTVRNRRADVLHKLSRWLVEDYDLVVHEDLAVSNMARRPKARPNDTGGYDPNGAAAKTGLNRSIYDAGWGTLLSMISYKAEERWQDGRGSQSQEHQPNVCSLWSHRGRQPAPSGVRVPGLWSPRPRRHQRGAQHLAGRLGPSGCRLRSTASILVQSPSTTKGWTCASTASTSSAPGLISPEGSAALRLEDGQQHLFESLFQVAGGRGQDADGHHPAHPRRQAGGVVAPDHPAFDGPSHQGGHHGGCGVHQRRRPLRQHPTHKGGLVVQQPHQNRVLAGEPDESGSERHHGLGALGSLDETAESVEEPVGLAQQQCPGSLLHRAHLLVEGGAGHAHLAGHVGHGGARQSMARQADRHGIETPVHALRRAGRHAAEQLRQGIGSGNGHDQAAGR